MRRLCCPRIPCAAHAKVLPCTQSIINSVRCSSSAILLEGTNNQRAPTAKYYDARTWPKTFTGLDIGRLLRPNLARSAVSPNYDTLATLLQLGDTESLGLLLRKHTKPPQLKELTVESYLKHHTSKPAVLPLREGCAEGWEKALSLQPGSEKRNIAFCATPRDSDTTELVKQFVYSKRREAMKCGRVIVRCCETESNQKAPWMMKVQGERATNQTADASSVQEGLCELIRSHVESVTGYPQSLCDYCDPQTAYASWMSETARCFAITEETNHMEPLIILDTCEQLARDKHKYLVHRFSERPYTLLEAFCLAIPSPRSIFVLGNEAKFDTSDPVLLAIANIRNVGTLTTIKKLHKQNRCAAN